MAKNGQLVGYAVVDERGGFSRDAAVNRVVAENDLIPLGCMDAHESVEPSNTFDRYLVEVRVVKKIRCMKIPADVALARLDEKAQRRAELQGESLP